ncbi:MAG: NTPase [Methanomassiliicoccaceae archaeon]|jgi:nucleoside-triphosphatase|nr:NTPase [Methanomassiliicoccaceae archaeon]
MITDIKIGITGLPGAGKTKTLLRVIEMLSVEELKIGGMITEPIMDGRRKVGFSVQDIVSKENSIFAHIDIESRIMDGKMGVDLAKFESVAVNAIRAACETCDIIVIDEVGKVEVESQAFIDAVKFTLDAGKPMILTLHKKSRNPLLQDIRRRDDVRILEVTPTNRNLLPHKIIRLMNGENM